MNRSQVTVEVYAGYKGEETPRSFTIGDIRLLVQQVGERWYSETHSYFRVCANDGHRYVLRCDLELMQWEIVMREGK